MRCPKGIFLERTNDFLIVDFFDCSLMCRKAFKKYKIIKRK